MKRIVVCAIIAALLIPALCGCGGAPGAQDPGTADTAADTAPVDVDLTQLNATMVYAQVNDMLTYPDKYVGMKVRMRGPFAVYETEERNYFAVIITDATACCSQGIEFCLTEDYSFPDDYPEEGDTICVQGTFDTYIEDGGLYCTLRNARLVL